MKLVKICEGLFNMIPIDEKVYSDEKLLEEFTLAYKSARDNDVFIPINKLIVSYKKRGHYESDDVIRQMIYALRKRFRKHIKIDLKRGTRDYVIRFVTDEFRDRG